MLIISEIKLNLDENEAQLKAKTAKKLHIREEEITSLKIYSKSLDARKELQFSYQVLISTTNEKKLLKNRNVSPYTKPDTSTRTVKTDIRPIIIGYGPSGIFCAYRLMEAGICPVVFEKGKRICDREKDVDAFFNGGEFNPDSNVQFGEGGAGTFSDAKLTTRVKNPFVSYILDVFVEHGAKEEIRYRSHAHVGTDDMRKVIARITDDLIERGAEFHFEEEINDFIIENGAIRGVVTNKGNYYSDTVILGIGHSARETIKTLMKHGVFVEKKDMAIGFRVEHPQKMIDKNQYNGIEHPKLEPSEYFLRYKGEKGVYSFCMCPGGYVVPSNSEKESIVTNGMSYSGRGNNLANSAILIQINKDEFEDGYEYLENLERKAYSISNSYKALSMNIKDYLSNRLSPLIFPSSYPLGTVLYNLNDFFSEKDNRIFKEAILDFDRKIDGFIENGIMVGPETRSSSPVRIKRNETHQSITTRGLYPMGEGAGYGGGIMSCALDGIRIANQIISTLL